MFCIFVKMMIKGYLFVNIDGMDVSELDMKLCYKLSYSWTTASTTTHLNIYIAECNVGLVDVCVSPITALSNATFCQYVIASIKLFSCKD